MTAPADGIDRLIHFVETRLAQLNMSKQEVADRGGPGVDTLVKARRRKAQNTPAVGTLLRLDATLGWQPGSAAVVLLGGHPMSLTPRRNRAGLREKKHPLRPISEDEITERLTAQLRDELDRLAEDHAAVERRIDLIRRVLIELDPDEQLGAWHGSTTSIADANSA